jgi:polysaccharide biosynthesis protein PslG
VLFVTIRIIKTLVVAGVLVLLVATALIADTNPTATVHSSAPPASRGYKGASTHGRTVAQLRHLRRAAGITWYRDDALWADAEPRRGAYRWGRLDHIFRNARIARMNVLLIIDYGTSWSGTPPASNDDYARFARAVADRYHDFGGRLAFEFWNEPFMSWTWNGQRPDPAKYAAMVRAAATAVRSRGYGITLMANVDLQNYADGSGYFDELVNADPGLYKLLDAWSLHPYASNCGPLSDVDASCLKLKRNWRFDRIAKFQAVARHRGVSRPVWVTEFGWSTCTDDPNECVTEEQQASYTAQAISRARKEWGVRVMFIHTGDRDAPGPDRESRYGMYRGDGSSKPVVAAIAKS